MIYVLAAIGAVSVARHAYRIVRLVRRDLKSKPTPWLGLPWGLG
jgi:hypothetical protein